MPSIAVLPFANLSADPEQEYFCDGLAEELIDALARLEGLRVVARTSAFHFKGQSPDLREVGQKLNVKTVLEGSVRKAGTRLRINAQLINTEDGYHLWPERYEREMDDVFAVQDEIAGSVVDRLKVKLLGAAKASLVRQQTDDVEAFDLCVKGQHHVWKLTVEGIDAALLLFERSLAVDPSYAQAHAGVALAYAVRGALGLAPPGELLPKAKEAARRAIALDDEVRNAHYVLAQAHQSFDWDWPGAEHEFRRELAVNPGNAEARGLFGLFLLGRGDLSGALRETQRAVDADPLSPLADHMRAWVLLEIDCVEDAVQKSRHGVQVSGGFSHAYWSLGAGLSLAQRHQEAMDTLAMGSMGSITGSQGSRG